MYSSSPWSSSTSNNNNDENNKNLHRYASAPSVLFDSVVGTIQPQHQHQLFDSTQSKIMSDSSNNSNTLPFYGLPENSNGLNTPPVPPQSNSNLIRHSSSPAGFLNHLTADIGMESYNNNPQSGQKLSRLGSQLNFTKQESHHHNSLPRISETNDSSFQEHLNKLRLSSAASQSRPVSGFSLSPWDDHSGNSSSRNIAFSASSSKRTKGITDDDILNGFASIDSQAALEIATMERMMHLPQDSVPCKIRAKRGCATHPRSIAERERRTRISGKLKKLQDLVPNMDKQTSYSDMLDLAVQHIKGLQGQIQTLNKELEGCTCGCKESTKS